MLIETESQDPNQGTPPPTPIPGITFPPNSGAGPAPQIIVNVPKPPDFIFDHLNLWITLTIIIVCCCLCCVFLYFCWEKLLPCVAFMEHCIFYTIKAAFLPVKLTYELIKIIVYPIKECILWCTKGTGEYYRPYTRTT
jgi:hypothetical protein